MKIWIVCQQSAGQIASKVAAFKDKELAAADIAMRIKRAPDHAHFWLESVDMADQPA